MEAERRIPVGLWSEIKVGQRWANEGVSRVIGFLVEGAAVRKKYTFHIVVPHGVAETVREDLRQLNAVEGIDWCVWEPPSEGSSSISGTAMTAAEAQARFVADYANRSVPVEGWVVTFPHFSGALHLEKPKATLFPDALPYDFPLGWPEETWQSDGGWPAWRSAAARVMADSDAVITFSDHVATRHAGPLCGVAHEKIRIVPLAPPDLSRHLHFLRNRRQTTSSRFEAAEILRSFVRERKLDYLRDFPFHETDFIAAATQDRPSKNLGLTADALRRIVREHRRSMKLFVTAQLHFGAGWTRLPGLIEGDQLHRDILSIPDLPREVHAALFHCATVVVHSSFFEGIIGALPFFEAASVGTPSLLADGPHIGELLKIEPKMRPFVYDPYDARGLARLVCEVSDHRQEIVEAQAQIFKRVSQNSWADVASAYAEAALEGAKGGRSVQREYA